jgi:hypothetical protein
LEPLHARLAANVFAAAKLFADDTLIAVLEPGRGRTKTRPVVGVYALPTSLSDRFARAMRIPSVRARSPRSISARSSDM